MGSSCKLAWQCPKKSWESKSLDDNAQDTLEKL